MLCRFAENKGVGFENGGLVQCDCLFHISGSATFWTEEVLTLATDLSFQNRLTRAAGVGTAHQFEVFRGIVHFLALHICDDYPNVVTALIMHAAEEHYLGKLNRCTRQTRSSNVYLDTHHGVNDGHHRKLPLLHCTMMIHVGRPRPVQRNETPSVDGATKEVFRDEFAFVPSEHLAFEALRDNLPLAQLAEPVEIRVVAVLQPFVDEHVRYVVIESFANKFAHREARRRYELVGRDINGHCDG